MKLIDIHTHIYPDAIARKAAASIREFYELGTDEMEAGMCSVKNMKTGQQITVTPDEAAEHILQNLSTNGPIILEK